jgi:hypothetical protein
MITQERLETCMRCISPDDMNSIDTDYGDDPDDIKGVENNQINIFNGFMDDDHHSFMSEMCLGCQDGIVPSHLPSEQVIRYIKNIFKKKGMEL